MKEPPELPQWCRLSGVGHGILDPEGFLTRVNPHLCEILRRPEEEISGRALEELIHESSLAILREAREQVLSGELPCRCMYLHFPAPGGGRIVADVFLTRFDGWLPGAIVVQMINITRHKETESQLANAKRRIHLTADVAGMGFWEYDFKTGTQNWDNGVLRIHGIRREEFSGRWNSYVHPEDLPDAERSVWEAVRGVGSGEQHFRVIRPDGAIRHIHTIFTVERDPGGNPLSLTGVNFDITETIEAREAERRNEAKLVESRQILERILVNIPVPVLVHDLGHPHESRAFVMLNRQFTETLGYSLADMPTVRHWYDLAYPDETYRAMVENWWHDALDQAARGDGLIENVEFQVVAKDGSRRDIVFNATLVGGLVVIALRDATGQKKAAADLEAAYRTEALLRDEAEQAAKARTRFLAGVSHEIRTPIAALVNISQSMLLESGKHSLPAEFLEHLETVRAGGQYLNLILTNILDASAAESGHAPVRASTFYLVDWVEDIGAILGPIARARSVEIVWCLPEDENEQFTTDPVRLSQILLNLAHNAVKFSSNPGARVWISVALSPEGVLRLGVSDEGAGIPASRLDGLFREFGQIDRDPPPADRGVGLGLAVVRQNTVLLGGKISTHERDPHGICFEIELPPLKKAC